MPQLAVEQLTFDFPAAWSVSQFDTWVFYINHFQSVASAKAVDVLAIDRRTCAWAIEVKDYRRHRRTKAINIATEIAIKVRDSFAAIAAAQVNAYHASERASARDALNCPRIRVVLHLEQPQQHSRLFPRAINPANVELQLRQLVRAFDPHPLVVELANMRNLPWTAQ